MRLRCPRRPLVGQGARLGARRMRVMSSGRSMACVPRGVSWRAKVALGRRPYLSSPQGVTFRTPANRGGEEREVSIPHLVAERGHPLAPVGARLDVLRAWEKT